jgi:hypothetical protein
LAAYHLEGAAQMWYQLFKENEESIFWETLKVVLYTRYGPTQFEDHFSDLTKTAMRLDARLPSRI